MGDALARGRERSADSASAANIAEHVWRLKYRSAAEGRADASLEETFERVARAASAMEPLAGTWRRRLMDAFASRKLLPAGRILAHAGRGRLPLLNTYVIPPVSDDPAQLLDCLSLSGASLAAGGGIGMDFSDVPPAARGAGVGPLAVMDLWNNLAEVAFSRTDRRGAMMAVLDGSHPDVLQFIAAKRQKEALRNFNISVLASDEFMAAVREDRRWSLEFRGQRAGVVRAREVWGALVAASHEGSEPGVLFVDRLRKRDNLAYCESISATNSCAEQPLPAFGAAPLASLNLAELVRAPLTEEASIDTGEVAGLAGLAVRFLDNVLELTTYPDPRQARVSRRTRRIGVGVTGVGDALALCGARYGRARSLELLSHWLGALRDGAYAASVELARERRCFELFDRERYLAAPFVGSLPSELRRDIERHGMRNGALLSIAPTGSVSLLAGNVSSGIEPIFSHTQTRRIGDARGHPSEVRLDGFAVTLLRKWRGHDARLPDSFVTCADISPSEHIATLATAQRFIDASISKTINFPEQATIGDMAQAMEAAHALGCKSVSVYRPSPLRTPILTG